MTKSPYYFHIKLSTLATIVIVITILGFKFAMYFKYGHHAVLASTLDSVSDLLASLIAFVAIRYSHKPVDDEHKFGHYKVEAISSLVISFIIVISSLGIIYNSISSLLTHQFHTQQGSEVYWVLIFSGLASLCIYLYQSYLYKKTHNLVIKADAVHYQADFLLNIVVLVSVYVTKFFPAIDSIAAIIIACYIIYILKHSLFEAIDQLMDREIPDKEKNKIKQIVETNGYNIINMRTRKSGPKLFIYFQLPLSQEIKLTESEAIILKLEQQIAQHFPEIELFIRPIPL